MQGYLAVRLDDHIRDVKLLSVVCRPAFGCRRHNCALDKIVGCTSQAVCVRIRLTLEPFAAGAVRCCVDPCFSGYGFVSLEFKNGAFNVARNRTEVKLYICTVISTGRGIFVMFGFQITTVAINFFRLITGFSERRTGICVVGRHIKCDLSQRLLYSIDHQYIIGLTFAVKCLQHKFVRSNRGKVDERIRVVIRKRRRTGTADLGPLVCNRVGESVIILHERDHVDLIAPGLFQRLIRIRRYRTHRIVELHSHINRIRGERYYRWSIFRQGSKRPQLTNRAVVAVYPPVVSCAARKRVWSKAAVRVAAVINSVFVRQAVFICTEVYVGTLSAGYLPRQCREESNSGRVFARIRVVSLVWIVDNDQFGTVARGIDAVVCVLFGSEVLIGSGSIVPRLEVDLEGYFFVGFDEHVGYVEPFPVLGGPVFFYAVKKSAANQIAVGVCQAVTGYAAGGAGAGAFPPVAAAYGVDDRILVDTAVCLEFQGGLVDIADKSLHIELNVGQIAVAPCHPKVVMGAVCFVFITAVTDVCVVFRRKYEGINRLRIDRYHHEVVDVIVVDAVIVAVFDLQSQEVFAGRAEFGCCVDDVYVVKCHRPRPAIGVPSYLQRDLVYVLIRVVEEDLAA